MTNLFVSPSGGVTTLTPDEAVNAEALGYVPASPEEIRDFEIQAKYGAPGQQAIAAAEGLGRGLSARLSTGLETALGVPPEDIAARAKANPGTAVLSEGAGLIGGLAVPFSGPAAIAKAGLAAKGTSVGLKGAVARTATEGALYGVGQIAHESALGDPALTAESAMATVGLTTLAGGSLGVAGHLLGGAVRKFTPKDMGTKLAGWLGDFEGERNLKAAGAIQPDLKRLTRQKGHGSLVAIGREGGELGLVSPLSTAEQTFEKAAALANEAGAEIGSIIRTADESSALPAIRSALAKAEEKVLAPLAANPLEQDAARTVAGYLKGYAEMFPGEATFADMHAIRKQLDTKIYGLRGSQDPLASTLRSSLRDVRRIVSEELGDGIARAKLGPAWRAANRRYEVASVFEELADAGMLRGAGNNMVSLTEGLGAIGGGVMGGPVTGALTGLGTALVRRHAAGTFGAAARMMRHALTDQTAQRGATLVALERANAEVATSLEAQISTLVRGGVKAKNIARAEVESGIASVFGHDPDASAALYARRVDAIRKAAVPEVMLAQIAANVRDLQDAAPTVAQELGVAQARLMTYLHSKIPPDMPTGMLGKPAATSKAQMRELHQIWEAASDPLAVVKQAAAGTATPAGMETLRVGFPKLYDRAAMLVLAQIAKHGADSVGRSQYAGISQLMGEPMHASLKGAAIWRNQPKPRPMPGPVRPTATGMSKLNGSGRMQTRSQQAERRGP